MRATFQYVTCHGAAAAVDEVDNVEGCMLGGTSGPQNVVMVPA
jgi:hypothetical protein